MDVSEKGKDEYRLKDLQAVLVKSLGVSGLMQVYEEVAGNSGRRVSEVRRWFTPEDKSSFRQPPQVESVWEYLEKLSKGKLDRKTYYSTDFWE